MGRGSSKAGKSGTVAAGGAQSADALDLNHYLKEMDYRERREYLNERFGVDLTEAQADKVTMILRGVNEYDHDYDGVTYNIREFEITPLAPEIGSRDVNFHMVTVPVTDSPTIRMMDTKRRNIAIGARGGLWTMRNGRRQKISDFDARYGTRD